MADGSMGGRRGRKDDRGRDQSGDERPAGAT
jgi:hypothetical protein